MSIMGGAGFGGLGGGAGSGAFAGIPPELQAGVARIEAEEPAHPRPDAVLEQQQPPGPPLTLRSLAAGRGRRIAVVAVLIAGEVLLVQSGPLLTQVGIDVGILQAQPGVLAAAVTAYLLGTAAVVAVVRARVRLSAVLSESVLEALRVRVFTHLQRLGVDHYDREQPGRIITRMTSDVEALHQLCHEGLVQLATQGLTLVVVLGAMIWLDPLLSLVALGVVLPPMLVMTRWFARSSTAAYRDVRVRIAEVVSHLAEQLAGLRVALSFNRHRHDLAVHRDVVGAYRDANVATGRLAARYSAASEGVGVLGQAVVLVVGAVLVSRGRMGVGELTAFLLYLTQVFAPIQQLVAVHNAYQRGQTGLAELRTTLVEEPSVPERPGAADLPPVAGRVRLEGVSFGYRPDRPVLHDVDLAIPAGQVLAIVGPTGAGKSTIARLLVRFVDPTAGRVLVDGVDVAEVTLRSLRRQVVLVPQEPFLFAGTIAANAAVGRDPVADDAAEADVDAACRAVGLGALLDRSPDGVRTTLPPRGTSLSAGERQQLALARALLADPAVLVLDEATANLDLDGEAVVEAAIQRLLRGRTAVIIAHRLATAMRADRVVVVDGGRIVQDGAPADLLASPGPFAELHAAWRRKG